MIGTFRQRVSRCFFEVKFFQEIYSFHDDDRYPENMITIPAEVGRRFGVKPGHKLDWQPVAGTDEILAQVIPDRGELARRLMGLGAHLAPERDVIAELDEERAREDRDRAEERPV